MSTHPDLADSVRCFQIKAFLRVLDAENMIKRGFLPALREGGIRTVRCHDLRHTNASLRIEQRQNQVYASEQIGQALMKEVHPEQAEKLDEIIGCAEHPVTRRKVLEEC